MTTSTNEITSKYWQPKKGEIGEVVEGIEDINQCIENIVMTRKGSVPHNPEFGCDAWKYVDAPEHIAIPNMKREIIDALTAWEARITVTSIETECEIGHVTITIYYEINQEVYTKEVTI